MSDSLAYAVGVALSPLPIAAMTVLLAGRRASVNGAAFLSGWAAGVTAALAACILLVREAGVAESDPLWIVLPELALGLVFLLIGVLALRAQPGRAGGVLALMDSLTPQRSAALGVVLSAVNPKVAALTLGAALSAAKAGDDADVLGVGAFVLVAALGVLVPLGLYTAFPGRATPLLRRLHARIERHERALVVGLSLGIAAIFLVDAVRAL